MNNMIIYEVDSSKRPRNAQGVFKCALNLMPETEEIKVDNELYFIFRSWLIDYKKDPNGNFILNENYEKIEGVTDKYMRVYNCDIVTEIGEYNPDTDEIIYSEVV